NILWLTYQKNYTEYIEDSRNTWYDYGVMSFDGTTFTDYPDEETGFSTGYKRTIVADQNNVIWFDTTSFDGTTWKTYSDDGAGHSIGGPVAVDNNNLKWFGASGGVVSFDGTDWEYYQIDNLGSLKQIAVDSGNVKWFLSQGSATSFDGSRFEHFEHPETKSSVIYDMDVDTYGFKWFLATSYPQSLGLLCYDNSNWTYFRDDFWLLNAAGEMVVDHNNVKWIVTTKGIASFDGGPTVEPTQVSKTEELPSTLSITANYPNPFNPSTTIEFVLPECGMTSLAIFNIRGQIVRELVATQLSAGKHTMMWDGKNGTGMPVSSGVYFSRLIMGENVRTGKMLLMK
ncbi:FlgD immunoglobulin-like domain containing protein, partial [Candidatus Omnitrophota bacterium]